MAALKADRSALSSTIILQNYSVVAEIRFQKPNRNEQFENIAKLKTAYQAILSSV